MQIVTVEGKKFKVPVIVAREGPFILVRRLTKPPKALGIEFVVKKETRFGTILISSQVTGKTKQQGKRLLKGAVELDKLSKKAVQAAKQAGVITAKGLIAAGRIGFRLAEKASRPRSRAAKKRRGTRKAVKRRSKKRKKKR